VPGRKDRHRRDSGGSDVADSDVTVSESPSRMGAGAAGGTAGHPSPSPSQCGHGNGVTRDRARRAGSCRHPSPPAAAAARDRDSGGRLGLRATVAARGQWLARDRVRALLRASLAGWSDGHGHCD
jgi:hypothetical protein